MDPMLTPKLTPEEDVVDDPDDDDIDDTLPSDLWFRAPANGPAARRPRPARKTRG